MCEISEKWMKQGYANGRMEKAIETIISLLTKKLGYLSENIIIKINNSDEDILNELTINIFDIKNEDDILKYK